ncbi:hypothetical protein IQ266_04230 [filamentous cyanobacterium LEGE 11480]|uniref:Uncharacterized protein n=1 Tax=Romeriopsis navalis LEGE 11480 TaxID=2777977 RepID=A0A928Z347_9CYAN|nr:hypothetical protein [Romeriopsis navalis]MBE9028970.1 hypothetical protein [Romeriopsis navalis LEGE 11480]
MNLPLVLDVIISLVFIYLVLSLLASEIQELIATLLQWRARHLKDSIANLISGGTGDQRNRFAETKVVELVNDIYDDPLIKNVNQEARGLIARGFRLITRIFPGNHRGDYGKNQATGPSYIPSDTFATAFIERLGVSGLVDRLVENRLEKFIHRIIGDVVIYDDIIQLSNPQILPGAWELAAKYGVDLGYDLYFRGLVEDYESVLQDYRRQYADIGTCVSRLSEALDRYTDAASSDSHQAYYVERVKAMKMSLFGKDNERILYSAGLQPTMQEVAGLLDRGSLVYKELATRYDNMQNQADSITQYATERAKALRSYSQNKDADLEPFLNQALGELNTDEYRIYQDYQNYQKAAKVIDSLPDSVRTSMEMLSRRAQSTVATIDGFRTEVAGWFDSSMSRASGVYKRNAKGAALIIGFVIAAFTNADTFHMLNRVSSDETLREVITSQATQIRSEIQVSSSNSQSAKRPGEIAQELEMLKNETDQVLSDMSLPITWNPSNLSRQLGCAYNPIADANAQQSTDPYALLTRQQWNQLYRSCMNKPDAKVTAPVWLQVTQMIMLKPFAFLRMISGWFISGIAIGMGAPFWFDLLSRLVNVRNAGGKPKSSAE